MITKILFVVPVLVVFMGCESSGSAVVEERSGLARQIESLKGVPVVQSVEAWAVPDYIENGGVDGLSVTTAHYRIYTTLEDPLILRQAPMFLESAYRSYSDVMGATPELSDRLEMYLFKNRRQWEAYTREHTGAMSEVYLKIQAGAYYLDGKCIAYHLGRKADFSVLAHEGWHQFSHSLFAYRLPAWVDEGLATNFEAYHWEKGRVTFKPRMNGGRLISLKQTLASGKMFRLSELLTLEPGGVVGPRPANEGLDDTATVSPAKAYYAQVYALIRFLREEDYGRRLIALRRMLHDGYQGRWPLDERWRLATEQANQNPTRQWSAAVGTFLFKQYLSPPEGEIENEYQQFCQKISYTVREAEKR